MAMYWKEITVNWGESDPFGLVYYPRIVAWFNDTEHDLFRTIGYPIEQMIKNDRTTFVMGEIHFRFIGPAAYGDRIITTIHLAEIGEMKSAGIVAISDDGKPVLDSGLMRRAMEYSRDFDLPVVDHCEDCCGAEGDEADRRGGRRAGDEP